MTDKPAKWRWALYGLIVGAVVSLTVLILDGRGYEFAPWLQQGTVRSLGFSGIALIFGIAGLVAGLVRDRISS